LAASDDGLRAEATVDRRIANRHAIERAERCYRPRRRDLNQHAIAHGVRSFLEQRDLYRVRDERGGIRLLVTDAPKSFEEVAGRFLGDVVQNVELIDL